MDWSEGLEMVESPCNSDFLSSIKNGLTEEGHWLENPFSKASTKVSSAWNVRIPSLETLPRPKRKVRLAFVSLPAFENIQKKTYSTMSDEHPLTDVDHTACKRRLVNCSDEIAKVLARQYRCAVSLALKKYKANIVCVNELGFPATEEGPLRSEIEETKQLAEQCQALIIAGSAHDSRTFYNTGHLYYPGCATSGVHYYHKQVSANREDEFVSIPSERRTIVTQVFNLKVAVIICLDIADYSTVAGVVKLGDAIDLLLVPAYTKWIEPLEKVAAAASAAMPGMVALVNYYKPGKTPSYLYRFGSIDSGLKKVNHTPSDHGRIHLYDINVASFHKEKMDMQERVDERLTWLFGLKAVKLR